MGSKTSLDINKGIKHGLLFSSSNLLTDFSSTGTLSFLQQLLCGKDSRHSSLKFGHKVILQYSKRNHCFSSTNYSQNFKTRKSLRSRVFHHEHMFSQHRFLIQLTDPYVVDSLHQRLIIDGNFISKILVETWFQRDKLGERWEVIHLFYKAEHRY